MAFLTILQIWPFQVLRMRRETSPVSFLMCPFCVRELLTSPTTSRIVWNTGHGGWPCLPVGGCVSVVTGPAQPRASTISPSSRPYSVNS
jgi:hypothetical protein